MIEKRVLTLLHRFGREEGVKQFVDKPEEVSQVSIIGFKDQQPFDEALECT